MKIIQFLPYFPPHKGGVENVAKEWSIHWLKKGFGEVINVVFSVGQDDKIKMLRGEDDFKSENISSDESSLIYDGFGNIIGYHEDGYKVLILPAFDLIFNFPFPKFRTRQFREVRSLAKDFDTDFVQTHTRFFISSILGGFFAKLNKKKWSHIEHGSSFVQLSSGFKIKIAYIYDMIFGKWIFRNADKLIAISEGVKSFVKSEFNPSKEIDVIYSGFDINVGERPLKQDNIIHIGFVGRLVKLKGVDLLLEAFDSLLAQGIDNVFLHIIGNGDELFNLKNDVIELGLDDKVKFYGMIGREMILSEMLPVFDILVNPSFQEGLPTTVYEGLLAGCVVVASDVGGTCEISSEKDLILFEKGNLQDLKDKLKIAVNELNERKGFSSRNIQEKFDWNRNIKQYYAVLKR